MRASPAETRSLQLHDDENVMSSKFFDYVAHGTHTDSMFRVI
jgi:hypothetical protein